MTENSSQSLIVRRNRIVHLQLSVHDADSGEVLEDTAENGADFVYLHGHDSVLPALENALAGKVVGHAFSVTVPNAYGPVLTDATLTLPTSRIQLPEGSAVGDSVTTPGPNGQIDMVITHLNESMVTLNGNHPLAGRALTFSGLIVQIARAHKDEIRHHRPHPAGHNLMVKDSSYSDKMA